MAQRRKFACRDCGKQCGSFLYCNATCHDNFADKRRAKKAEFLAAGFTQHEEARNIFIKDGVSVSLEMGMKHGIEEAHAKAAKEVESYRHLDPDAADATAGS